MNDEELDEMQDKLSEEADEEESQAMKVDNRSIFTIQDTLVKKAQPEDERKEN